MQPDYHPRAEDIHLVGVLQALADPVRLSVVRQLADGRARSCGSIVTPLRPSAMTRHFRVLRESGLLRTEAQGVSKLLTLRQDDLEERFPGLLDAVVRASEGASEAPSVPR